MVFIMQHVLCHIVFIAKEAKHIIKYYYVMLYNILYFPQYMIYSIIYYTISASVLQYENMFSSYTRIYFSSSSIYE